MNNKRKFKIVIDILMPVLLVTLMAYQLIGKAYHEYAGIALFVIFIIHNLLNIKWYSVLFKGKYSPYRVVSTVINVLILVTMILTMVSGIIMSQYAFSFIEFKSGASVARLIHLSSANLGYVLISLHLGMHLGVMFGKNPNRIVQIILAFISIYGIYATYTRNIFEYIFLINKFAFFDFNENLFLFILDYITIMILFATISYIFSEFLKLKSKK